MSLAVKGLITALVAMIVLFNLPLIIGFIMMTLIMIVKLAWNLLWIAAIVGIIITFVLRSK